MTEPPTQLQETLGADVAVSAARVTTDPDTGGLVAHVSGPAEDELSAPLLLTRLRAALPDAAIPAMIRVYPDPLDEDGLDLAPLDERPAAVPFAPPRTELEVTLIDTWRLLMNLDALGIDDDFYEAGGHSLLVVEVLERLRCDHGLAVPAEVFFASPTVRTLAAAIGGGPGGGRTAETGR